MNLDFAVICITLIEVDDDLDARLDSYVSKINRGAVAKKVRRKVNDREAKSTRLG